MVRVQIDKLSVAYGSFVAVREVSLDIEPGDIFFLLGPSGCGKTTLLRSIAGLVEPSAGQILFNGKPMRSVPVHERDIGFVFQNYALWPHMTVAENVAYGLVSRKIEKNQRDQKVASTLRMLGLEGLERRRPAELSGGQQQRVALARAVVVEPQVLLLDEPLSNLDARLRTEMRREIKQLIRRLGLTTIYVTHDQREALSMADRVAVMNQGEVAQCAPPRILYTSPRGEFVASFVGEANLLEGSVAEVADDNYEIKTPVGRLTADLVGEFTRGEPVRVMVRPEDILIGPHGSATENALEGTIQDEAYLGGLEEVFVELSGGIVMRVVRIASGDENHIEIGDEVELSIPSPAVRLFKV